MVTSCDIKASRPFRAVCGSDDSTTVFYHGVPFKFEKTLKEHTRFVNCVRYNTSGSHFATVSSDGHVFLYDGKTGDLVRELGSPAHKGGIYACSWNKEGTKLLTASGDKTAKIFDIESGSGILRKFLKAWDFSNEFSCQRFPDGNRSWSPTIGLFVAK